MTDISDPTEDDDEEEIYAYKYEEDWPAAISLMGSTFLGGRPMNQSLGPVQQLKILVAAAQFRAPTPRRAGKGKPLPASEYEGEQETTQRKNTQKQCMRLILPKTKEESADVFLRRLDAHKNAPEALVSPLMPPEDETLFAKRCIAVKDTTETPDVLILPKGAKETIPEFEARLAVAKVATVLVFPRGAYESASQFTARLGQAKISKRPVMPRSAQEPEAGFSNRIAMQAACQHVVHPFDPAREDEKLYARRLTACKERTALSFEPGDAKAIIAAIGEEAVKKEPKAAAHAPSAAPAAADVMAEALAEEEALHAAEARAAEIQAEKAAKEAAALSEKEQEDARVAERIANMKLEQERARKEAEEALNKKHSFALEQIAINKIGFMPLKKLLMERGVPKEEVFACANKFALVEIAKKHADELKIEWVEE